MVDRLKPFGLWREWKTNRVEIDPWLAAKELLEGVVAVDPTLVGDEALGQIVEQLHLPTVED